MFKTFDKYPGLEILDCDQCSDGWHAARRGSAGSSDAKAAFAGGQGKTRATLMEKKIIEEYTGVTEPGVETYDMAQGKKREPRARRKLEEMTGLSIFQVGLLRNKKYPGFHSSPDGLSVAKEGLYGVEIKCPKASTQARYVEELAKNPGRNCPNEHRKQVDMHCIIGDLIGCFFFSYVPIEYVPEYLLEKTGGKWAQILEFVPAPSGAEKEWYLARMKQWNVDYAAMLPKAGELHSQYVECILKRNANLSAAIDAVGQQTEDLIRRLR